MIQVLIVSADSRLRQRLEESGAGRRRELAVVAQCSTVRAAQELVRGGARFDVALLDVWLEGAALARAVRLERPFAAALAVAGPEDEAAALSALRAGARGCVLRDTPPDRLAAAVAEVQQGGAPLAPQIARRVLDVYAREGELPPAEPALRGRPPAELTPRERDVLQLLTKGITYANVGDVLGIGLGTVQSHVKRIYEKLEVSSKAEATAIALSYRLVQP